MKHIWLTATLIMGVWAMSIAQINSQPEYYSIHLGSFVQLDPEDFSDVRPLGYLYAESFNEHLNHLFLGEYKTEASANSVLKTIHAKGFPDAYVSKRNLATDQKVEVIQLGIELPGERIAWKKYENALPISTIIDKEQLRIVAGPYPSHEATLKRVAEFKKAGYGNAFIRTEYSLRLHPVTDFEASDLFIPETPEPLVVVNETIKATPTPPIKRSPKKELDEEAVVVAKVAPEAKPILKKEPIAPAVTTIPDDYEPEFITKATAKSGLSMPAIRAEIKRTSALELQKVLKENKYYDGSLDGYYGEGTSLAFNQYKTESKDWQKYALLRKYMAPEKVVYAQSELIEAIDLVVGTPTIAKSALEKSSHPLSKAYQAYILRELSDDNMLEVNRLMNEANKESFADFSGDLPFDFTASYSYHDKDQLLKHLAFLHGVNKDVPVPCWLFQKHQYDAIQAFETVEDYTMESCDPFMDWEALQNLETIVRDIKPDSEGNLNSAASIRSQLFLNPQEFTNEEMTAIFDWNTAYWDAMDQWANSDALHKKIVTTMKISYYQSQVLIEDYYINSGIEYKQAKALGLTTLKTIVGKSLKK